MRPLLILLVLAALAGAAELPPGVVRVALLSDTHLAGPEYPLFGENGALDNASVTRTQQRLWRAVRAVNAMDPKPQAALLLGDVVHNGMQRLAHLGLDERGLRRLFQEPVNGYKVAAAILSELEPPPLYVWGNHDTMLTCGKPEASPPKHLTAQVWEHFFHAQAYAARDVGPWKIVALNSMWGHTWDVSDARCNPVLSSYGERQLRWLDAQLAEGKHTLVMMHFPLPTSVLDEHDTAERWRDLRSVLAAHPNVKLALSGHFHKGVDWEGLYPFPARTLPSVRYNPQNIFALDLRPDGTFAWVDWDKNRGGARCSDWWTYDGRPRFEAAVQPNDAGDCGVPAAGQEAAFPLGPVHNISAIPAQDDFNPEGSCRFVLARQFLEACAGGASEDCCDVVASEWRLSSSAPFSTCFCQPSFWEAAVEYMQSKHSVDLAATLGQCVEDFDKLILWRGGPLTWCPGAPGPPATPALAEA